MFTLLRNSNVLREYIFLLNLNNLLIIIFFYSNFRTNKQYNKRKVQSVHINRNVEISKEFFKTYKNKRFSFRLMNKYFFKMSYNVHILYYYDICWFFFVVSLSCLIRLL